MPATLNTIAPLHPFHCPYETCKHAFRSQSDLDNHILDDSNGEHVWCKKCKVGFLDWAAYRVHLAGSEKHIVCPVCAGEFKSSGGMQRHLKLSHQGSKQIKCFACDKVFGSAGGYIAHLEQGRCANHTQQQFKDTLLHKTMIGRVVEKGSESRSGARVGTTITTSAASMWSGTYSADGGVTISFLDTNDKNAALTPPLTPHACGCCNADTNEPLIGNINNDSHAKVANANVLVLETLSLRDDDDASTVKGGKSDDESAVETPQRKANVVDAVEDWHAMTKKLTDEANATRKYGSTTGVAGWKALAQKLTAEANASGVYCAIPTRKPKSNTTTATPANNRSVRARPSTNVSGGAPPSNGSGHGKTVVSGGAPPSNGTGHGKTVFKAGLQALNHEYKQAQRGGIPQNNNRSLAAQTQVVSKFDFDTKFWDPDHPKFNPEMFFEPVLSQYECPFESCTFKCEYPISLRKHLKSYVHAVTEFRCPRCLKTFKTNAALIQHLESPSVKCGIRDTANYQEILADCTAGYLTVSDERKTSRKVWNGSSTATDNGHRAEAARRAWGKRGLRYQAVRPQGFW